MGLAIAHTEECVTIAALICFLSFQCMTQIRLQQCSPYLCRLLVVPFLLVVCRFTFLSFISIIHYHALCKAALRDSKCDADVMMQLKTDCLDAIMLQRLD